MGEKVGVVSEAARSVCNSQDVPLLGIAFGPLVVVEEEASGSVIRQVSF